MKILFVTDAFYPSQSGGFAISVYFLAKALAQYEDIEIYVLTTNFDIKNSDIPVNRWVRRENINVYYINVPDFKKIFNISLYFLFNRNKIRKILDSIDFDIVNLNSFFSYLTHYIAEYAASKNKQIIISPHGEFFSAPLSIKSFKKSLFFKLKSVKDKISSANYFHFTSIEEENAFKNFIKNFNIDKPDNEMFILPNIVDDSIFKTPQKRISDYNFRYILFLGRISRIKNIEMLIKAFSDIKKDNLKLVIAGWTGEDSPYSNELKQLVKDFSLDSDVVFTEKRVVDDEKRALYQNAEATILCSHSENFGMVVLESLAQKTPVIAVKTTPWEGLESHKCGFWIEKDEISLKLAIEKVLSLTDAEKVELSLNALEYAKTFSSSKLAGAYKNTFMQIENMQTNEKSSAVDWHSRIAENFDDGYKLKPMFKERFAIWNALIEKYISKDNKVLDIGCGSGVFTFIAAKKSASVTGLDGSSGMLKICEQKKAAEKVENVNFIECNIENITSVTTEKYDVVICSSVIEYLEHPEAFFKDVATILKPEGYFIFSLPNEQSFYRKIEKLSFRFLKKPSYYKYVKHLFKLKNVEKNIDSEGFMLQEATFYGKVPFLSFFLRKLKLSRFSDTLFVIVAQKK